MIPGPHFGKKQTNRCLYDQQCFNTGSCLTKDCVKPFAQAPSGENVADSRLGNVDITYIEKGNGTGFLHNNFSFPSTFLDLL